MMGSIIFVGVMIWTGLGHAQTSGPEFRDCADCPDMAVIPAGSFIIGSGVDETTREGVAPESASRELPSHRVTISKAFALGKHEITLEQFAAFVAATNYAVQPGCLADYDLASDGWKLNTDKSWREPGFPQTAQHPAVCISWADAEAMTTWLSKRSAKTYRLPTEAEWEYAARAGTTTARYWGEGRDQACSQANVGDITAARHYGWSLASERSFACEDGFAHTAPVGRFTPNAFGLHDMLGNAWEWVADCFHHTYEGAPADGSAWVVGGCDRRVERGGGWSGRPSLVRAATRSATPPDVHSRHLGFRVARDIN